MIRVAIIGASGYTGSESIRLLLGHSEAQVSYLTALPEECGPAEKVFPQFRGRCGLDIEPLDLDKLSESSDVALCCLPHKVSMGFVPKLLASGVKVVDFSADYRLKDAAIYEKFYAVEHTDRENLAKAAFGLCELFRDEIRGVDLVANPGCYPTGAALAAVPALKAGLARPDMVIVNSVTGASGAGKNPSAKFHFPNMNENLFAYGVGTHRHMPEIEQILTSAAGRGVNVLFQPHVGPFDRGILSTVYMEPAKDVKPRELLDLYRDFYAGEPFVQVCDGPPLLKDVATTNYCHVFPTAVKGRIVVFSTIDNLVKGAAGQAIQNMNILFGLDETLGLR